nr:boophilin-G2-like [Rhipicephalus microplus]
MVWACHSTPLLNPKPKPTRENSEDALLSCSDLASQKGPVNRARVALYVQPMGFCTSLDPVWILELPRRPGPRKLPVPPNSATGDREQHFYNDATPTGNNFVTLDECQNTCWASLGQHSVKFLGASKVPFWPFTPPEVCTYPADSGPCKAYMPRFFYNTEMKKCEQFIYGGCGGNANNFLTFDACEKKCLKLFGVIPRA